MLSGYVSAGVIDVVLSVIIVLLIAPWLYRKKLAGDRFFLVSRNKAGYYDVGMLPSYITMLEGLYAKNKREMFFRKLEKLIDDLRTYPNNSKFVVVTHEKVENWLIAHEKVNIIHTEAKDKRCYFLRKLMILNFRGPLFENIQFNEIHFRLK